MKVLLLIIIVILLAPVLLPLIGLTGLTLYSLPDGWMFWIVVGCLALMAKPAKKKA